MNKATCLIGLDGSNPLAFLAALGAFRALSLAENQGRLRLHWEENFGGWRPFIGSPDSDLAPIDIVDQLHRFLTQSQQASLFEKIGPNLTISGKRLRFLAENSLEICRKSSNKEVQLVRTDCDFLAAFGCDAMTSEDDPDSSMQDTALRTMSGAGHQHFISFMQQLIATTDPSHLHASLFETWTYQDSGRGANLRWDPADDRRYAVRWKNPSADPNMTMRGANRLAIEALPLFTAAPVHGKLETTGFVQRRREGVRFTWPLWKVPLDLDTCRSLLQSSEIKPPPTNASDDELLRTRETWSRRGIAAVFQSQRITIGKFRNFTPAKAL